jgi:Holliday junction resolvasome RuvABC DNA-binding subunit
MNKEREEIDFEQMTTDMTNLGFSEKAIQAVIKSILDDDWSEDEPATAD